MMKKIGASLICLIFVGSAYAVQYTRDAGDTDWSNLSQWNWKTGTVWETAGWLPTASDLVLLNAGRVLTVDTAAVAGTIVTPNAANSSATLQITNNHTLTASAILVGHDTQANAHGLVTHSDGTINSGSVTLRGKNSGTGTYNLSNSGALNATTFTVGSVNATAGAGTGVATMNQSGGTAALTTANLGGIGNSSYNMTGGALGGTTLNVGSANALAAGTTTMDHSAGTVSSATVNVGGTGTSTYNLTGTGSLSPATALNVGTTVGKAGAVNQSGGTANAALNVGADGTYNLNGGILNSTVASDVTVNGTLTINGGTLSQDLNGVNDVVEINGSGVVQLQSGLLQMDNGINTSVVNLRADLEISGGSLDISGQPRAYGEFKVIGDAATIHFDRLGANRAAASFVFDLDADGVSTVDSTGGYQSFDGASLFIDGANYVHGGGTYTNLLFKSSNLDSIFDQGNVTVTNFADGLTVNFFQDQTNGKDYVGIEVIPEPAVLGLVVLFGGGMLFIRRMFQM